MVAVTWKPGDGFTREDFQAASPWKREARPFVRLSERYPQHFRHDPLDQPDTGENVDRPTTNPDDFKGISKRELRTLLARQMDSRAFWRDEAKKGDRVRERMLVDHGNRVDDLRRAKDDEIAALQAQLDEVRRIVTGLPLDDDEDGDVDMTVVTECWSEHTGSLFQHSAGTVRFGDGEPVPVQSFSLTFAAEGEPNDGATLYAREARGG